MRVGWIAFGLWSLLTLIPVSGWSQEALRADAEANSDGSISQRPDDYPDSNISNPRSPLKLTRTGARAEKSAKSSDKTASKPTGWGSMAGSLVIVLALIVGCGYLLKRQRVAAIGMLADDIVQVLGRKQLDPRTTLQFVRCGSKILVLSNSSQHGVRLLSEITDPTEVEAIFVQSLRRVGKMSRTASSESNSVELLENVTRFDTPVSSHGQTAFNPLASDVRKPNRGGQPHV
jgi:flagellar biogenesis protein FliO